MPTVTIADLASELQWKSLTPDIDSEEIILENSDINRPALQLSGFFEHFESARVQIIGNVEMAYISHLSREKKIEVFDKMFSFHIPCLTFCRGHMPDEDMLELARKHGVPLFSSTRTTGDVSLHVIRYTQKKMAPVMTVHGVLLDIFGEGVLITGESGIGKSEAALELIKRGHRLVADDAVELHRVSDTRLIGMAPEVTKHFIELRGIGIIDVKTLFGVESVMDEQTVDLVIRLEEWDRSKTYDRLGNQPEYVNYLGNDVMCYSIPIRPGRNVAVIVESAAVNWRQKKMGYDALDEFYKRVQNNLIKNR